MVRTRDTAGVKAVGAKAARKTPSQGGSSEGGSSENKQKYSSRNPVQPRETPSWQKPITEFFTREQTPSTEKEEVPLAKPNVKSSVEPKQSPTEIEVQLSSLSSNEREEQASSTESEEQAQRPKSPIPGTSKQADDFN